MSATCVDRSPACMSKMFDSNSRGALRDGIHQEQAARSMDVTRDQGVFRPDHCSTEPPHGGLPRDLLNEMRRRNVFHHQGGHHLHATWKAGGVMYRLDQHSVQGMVALARLGGMDGVVD